VTAGRSSAGETGGIESDPTGEPGDDDGWRDLDAWTDPPSPTAHSDAAPQSARSDRGRPGGGRPRSRPRGRLPGWTRRPPLPALPPPPEPVLPPLRYRTVEEFVTRLLYPTYRRNLRRQSVSWCPRWWAHTEAIARLEALWRAFEQLRLDPALGGVRWWLTYADPTMKALLADDGPFSACRWDRHTTDTGLTPLAFDPAPPGLFTTPADLRLHRPTPPAAAPPGSST